MAIIIYYNDKLIKRVFTFCNFDLILVVKKIENLLIFVVFTNLFYTCTIHIGTKKNPKYYFNYKLICYFIEKDIGITFYSDTLIKFQQN